GLVLLDPHFHPVVLSLGRELELGGLVLGCSALVGQGEAGQGEGCEQANGEEGEADFHAVLRSRFVFGQGALRPPPNARRVSGEHAQAIVSRSTDLLHDPRPDAAETGWRRTFLRPNRLPAFARGRWGQAAGIIYPRPEAFRREGVQRWHSWRRLHPSFVLGGTSWDVHFLA